MTMTPDAKGLLSKTIRGLRERLLEDLGGALQGEYRLGIAAAKAKLPVAQAKRRARLDAWVAEQVSGVGKKAKKGAGVEAEDARFRGEVVKTAAYTLLNRLVYLRLLEAAGLRKMAVATGGWKSRGYQDFRDLAPGLAGDETEGYAFLLRLVFDELAVDLPGLFGSAGIAELVPVPASTLRVVVEALDAEGLASCWTDDMTLGWVYQYWNDPEREALDEKLAGGGKVEGYEIASKTQMFTERYMVDWLLQNSLGPMWLAVCKKHGWTAEVEADGTLGRLEARRVEWRRKRESGEVELTELMPLETESERRWAYYVPQPIPEDAVEQAVESVRELKVLDPAVGSGHFLVVAVELLVALYREEARQRGEEGQERWSDRAIVERVLAENLFGIDLDPRAVQIAAAALWLKAQMIVPGAAPGRLNLVASNLRLASLPDDDAGLVELRKEVEKETGIPGALTDKIVHALKGADHLGSLLKVDAAVDEALRKYEEQFGRSVADQGGLFSGFAPKQERLVISREDAKETLVSRLEGFLARHSGSEDLGLRLLGEQLAAGVRFVRMVKEGTYDLVVGNPPYQGTAKMGDAEYVQKEYARGKADLYAAFLERGLGLAREGGTSALLTMRNWMFIKQYAGLREWLLKSWDMRALGDFDRGAFEDVPDEIVSVVVSIFRRATSRDVRSISLVPTSRDDRTRDSGRTARKRAAVLCHVGRHDFNSAALQVISESPLVYWWCREDLADYQSRSKIGEVSPAREGITTADNARFRRWIWESLPAARGWVDLVAGASGRRWVEPTLECVQWDRGGLEIKTKSGASVRNERFQNGVGVAFTTVGGNFGARIYRRPAIFEAKGRSVFFDDNAAILCSLNTSRARWVLESFNPSIDFTVGDVNRLPIFWVVDAREILKLIESAFTQHESHREPSVEFKSPGPSPWRHAQAWAQLAVDRPENTPLPPYTPELDPEPPTDHLSYALGIALGRFHPLGEGILDPTTADLSHALPSAILFLDGTLDPDDTQDSLGHPATAPLHVAWDTHASKIDTTRPTLRDYLRLDFFPNVHRQLYENRPIHFPLSSERRTFVAWISIHRWTPNTLRTLLAEHLHPTLTRLDGQLTDLRTARDSGDAKASRAAEKRFALIQKSRDELHQFITDVTQCAEQGPPPPDPKTPPRETDAPYAPDLDDGVMINSAALYPLLQPQWKDPKKWWKELATATGRKDYDWSHLAARYWPTRVDAKSRLDPSLAVAHRCFWRYHPERAYAWELRLQDEISPTFTIDEPDAATHRSAFLAAHPETAAELLAKELKRRERKANKADADDQGDLFSSESDADSEAETDLDPSEDGS
jgi:hypothetical protein